MYGITREDALEVLAKYNVEVAELRPIGKVSELEVRHWVADRLKGAHYTIQNELFNAVNLIRFEKFGFHGGCTVLTGDDYK